MKLYSSDGNYKLYHGNMLDMAEVIEPNSIDAIVTDPPYELNFMNCKWDNSGITFQKETWKKCYDILKSGGHMLVFGGSRTFHRIACAIEDAGFEIRDTIMWLYGCLSEDTEILTSNGWKNLENIKNNDDIYSLDFNKNNIIKNKCLNVFKYEYTGEMVNLKNQNTDQLLTPNHHCIMKDTIRTRIKGKVNYNSYNYWYYKDAWQIRSQSVKLPLASNYDGTLEIGNLFAELLGWVISEGTYLKDTNAITISQSSVNYKYVQRIRYILGKLKIKYTEYSRERIYKDRTYIEYEFYIGKDSWDIVNKIKTLAPKKKLTWNLLELSLSNKEFLIKGLLQGDGSKDTNAIGFSAFNQKDLEQLEIFQVLLHMTNKQGWINKNKHCCSIHNNPITELQGKHHKNRFVQYNGKYVWCIETEVGNFIARRNGKVFITGNSGFPKSMNIGLAIDKKNGVESPVIGQNEQILKKQAKDLREGKRKIVDSFNSGASERNNGFKTVSADIKQAQNEWAGWGTQLKPSYEPIIIARKPCEGSIVDNVMKYGVGGINIDECRVGNEERVQQQAGYIRRGRTDEEVFMGVDKNKPTEPFGTVNGRFPANTILTYDESDFDEVCGGFPNNDKPNGSYNKNHDMNNKIYGKYNNVKPFDSYGDSGSASRYFYCAKATKRDRDEGLEEFELKENNLTYGDGFNCKTKLRTEKQKENNEVTNRSLRHNIHPTVKPTSLMAYLVRLVTPKGGTVLDPFNGSGSTGKACMYENADRNTDYKYIGIELTEEYLPISKARIEFAEKNPIMDYDIKKTKTETNKIDDEESETIFDLI